MCIFDLRPLQLALLAQLQAVAQHPMTGTWPVQLCYRRHVEDLSCLAAGREMLIEEEVAEDQIEAELAPLTTQLAYLAAQLGRSSDAVASLEVGATAM